MGVKDISERSWLRRDLLVAHHADDVLAQRLVPSFRLPTSSEERLVALVTVQELGVDLPLAVRTVCENRCHDHVGIVWTFVRIRLDCLRRVVDIAVMAKYLIARIKAVQLMVIQVDLITSGRVGKQAFTAHQTGLKVLEVLALPSAETTGAYPGANVYPSMTLTSA